MIDYDNPVEAHAERTTKVSSAVTPALLLAGTCVAGGLAGLQIAPQHSNLFLLLAIGGPLLGALQITFFTIFDRERLHSESHIERKMLISKLRPQLGDAGTVIEIAANEQAVENPAAKGEGDV